MTEYQMPQETATEASLSAVPEKTTWERLRRNPKSGRPEAGHLNTYIILTTDSRWSEAIWFSTRDRCVYLRVPGETLVRALTEQAVVVVQLWLEAVYDQPTRFLSSLNHTLRLIAEEHPRTEETLPEVTVDLDTFWVVHPWFPPIRDFVDTRTEPFSIAQMCRHLWNAVPTTAHARTLSHILKVLGLVKFRMVTPDNPRAMMWGKKPPPYPGRGRPRNKIPPRRRIVP